MPVGASLFSNTLRVSLKHEELSHLQSVSQGSLSLHPLTIDLRSPFGTSHSSTVQRQNGLFHVKICSQEGFGECGLPPKKPGCYDADMVDCTDFIEAFNDALCSQKFADSPIGWETLPGEWFHMFRNASNSLESSVFVAWLRALNIALDSDGRVIDRFRAPRNGLECAILDCWSKCLGVPLWQAVHADNTGKPSTRAFYTVAMANEDSMTNSAKHGASKTPFVKIKLNDDIDLAQKILTLLEELHKGDSDDVWWCVDANSSWTISTAKSMLPVLKQFRRIKIVEQPFALNAHLGAEEQTIGWMQVKDLFASEGFAIYADESVRDATDVKKLVDISHGVNVKIDKAGGLIPAASALYAAERCGLSKWVGCMVSTALSCSCAATLLAHVPAADLDGAELVTSESAGSLQGGFIWNTARGTVEFTTSLEGTGDKVKGCGVVWTCVD